MSSETDGRKIFTRGKGDVNVHGNANEVHKNRFENGKAESKIADDFEQTPIWIAVMTYIAYAILILFGYLRDFMRFYGLEKSRAFKERGNKVCSENLLLLRLFEQQVFFVLYLLTCTLVDRSVVDMLCGFKKILLI